MTVPYVVELLCNGDYMTVRDWLHRHSLSSAFLANVTIGDAEHSYYAANPSEEPMLQNR